METPLIQLGIYEHYKGNQYEVMGVARHSEDDSWYVVYKPLYKGTDGNDLGFWIRPYDMFLEDVVIEGVQQKRFKLLEKK